MFNANLEVHTHNEYYLKLINTKTNTVENYTAKNYFCLPALSSCLFYPLSNTEVSSKGIVGISVYKKYTMEMLLTILICIRIVIL